MRHKKWYEPWFEAIPMAFGIPWIHWTLAVLALIALLLLCAFTGCASWENHDSYWNHAYLSGPGWAITDK